MRRPSPVSWARLVHLLRYLLGTPHLGLSYDEKDTTASTLTIWSDANWVEKDLSGVDEKVEEALKEKPSIPSVAAGRSRRGLLIQLGQAYVHGQSRLMSTPWDNSTDAEFKALAVSVKKGEEVRYLAKEMGLEVNAVMKARVDSEGAIKRGKNACMQKDARHMAVICGVTTTAVKEGRLVLRKVSSQHQRSDLLTKALGNTAFTRLRDLIMCDGGPL